MPTLAELREVYDLPLPDLIFRAAQVHRAHHETTDIQRCALLSIKTGGCPEDCGYCAQSAHYPNIITTRTYDARLNTLHAVQRAGIAVCCGGILGMGETEEDRLSLLLELARLEPPPESIPINCLVPIAGTPLEKSPRVDSLE